MYVLSVSPGRARETRRSPTCSQPMCRGTTELGKLSLASWRRAGNLPASASHRSASVGVSRAETCFNSHDSSGSPPPPPLRIQAPSTQTAFRTAGCASGRPGDTIHASTVSWDVGSKPDDGTTRMFRWRKPVPTSPLTEGVLEVEYRSVLFASLAVGVLLPVGVRTPETPYAATKAASQRSPASCLISRENFSTSSLGPQVPMPVRSTKLICWVGSSKRTLPGWKSRWHSASPVSGSEYFVWNSASIVPTSSHTFSSFLWSAGFARSSLAMYWPRCMPGMAGQTRRSSACSPSSV
mmetsp:Transcript_71305/g.220363  ORF Transcript_71305/g.220363 Transcript_71305/m.220363 type:complete len:295 (+) Transcript_71305:264-1148(+)